MGQPAVVGIIDDHEGVRVALDRVIRLAGYRTIVFESADHFLQSGRIHEPQCLVIDYNMPGTDGLELKRILARSHYVLPVIMVTADADEDLLRVALDVGMVAVISKRSPDTLIRVLHQTLHAITMAPSRLTDSDKDHLT